MSLLFRTVSAAALLGLFCVLAVQARSADEDEAKAAQKDVLALAERIAKGKAITPDEVKAFAKKHEDLDHVMSVFRPTARKGLGIEAALLDLANARKPLSR